MNSISTLTALKARLSTGFWLRHASRLPLLEQARLDSITLTGGGFEEMLAGDIPLDSDGPGLPMLTKLILVDVNLTSIMVLRLRDTLIERVEQGVPLEYLDLGECGAGKRATQLLAEIVVDVHP
jgi:hypothetical protein